MKTFFGGVAVALFLAGPLQAQIVSDSEPLTVPVEGYVVTHTLDTLRGKVNVSGQAGYVTQITLREGSGRKTKYKAEDIRAFGQKRPKLLRDFTDLTTVDKQYLHYESHEHPKREGKVVFMERLMDGRKIKLYNNPAAMESSTSLAGFKLSEKEMNYVVFKEGEKPYILRRRNYEEEFNQLFGDCEEFMLYVANHPELRTYKRLGTTIEQYNLQCE
ncbi:hypothetical protein SAMN05421823_103704 [Catalinimonas alkaloidigena]|uniref:Uncharacterized protein n=1 Tax=Catalinimonas alkaloidigena TaxID=1075417 RepID=A0A1G9F8A1_9BACT|nr:hypothetical protein [Catalinimonas alkaloidigena]SDK84637.1 hypothetical protein SAMN05421823_103704 [Catalinimonas alkaloidigena]